MAMADSTYASLKFLGRCRRLSDPVSFIVRLRLDAGLYELASLRKPGQVEATFQEAGGTSRWRRSDSGPS